jgi:uridine kinase
MDKVATKHPSVFPAKISPLLVAIVGGSGAGKSWLAKKLHIALDPDAVHLSLDDFYYDRSHLGAERRAKLNFDNPRAIDWLTVERTLNDLQQGRESRLPRYNFKTHCRSVEESALAPKPVVIMDGLWLLRRSSVRRIFGLKIFIECPARTRRSRRMTRDLRSRGRTRASVLEQLRKTVEPMYARFVAPQQKWADITLRHDVSEREVRRLAQELRRRLNGLQENGK